MWNLAWFQEEEDFNQSDTKSGRFILPTGRSGDLTKFRESPGESGRLNMYESWNKTSGKIPWEHVSYIARYKNNTDHLGIPVERGEVQRCPTVAVSVFYIRASF